MKTSFLKVLSAAMLMAPLSTNAMGIDVMIDGHAMNFVDVSATAWYANDVRAAAEAGIVNGYKDQYGKLTGKFGPGNNITMAEALKIALEGAGYDEEAYARTVSSDVNHWASSYVSVAMSEGFPIVPRGTVLNRLATRAEVAALISAAFIVDQDTGLVGVPYSDVNSTTEFNTQIESLTRDKVVSGDTDVDGQPTHTFRPTERINRAEVTKMVMKARATYGMKGEGRMPGGSSSSTTNNDNIVTYTDAGFSPSVLHVKKGEPVTFRNQASGGMWVASDPHPMHTGLAGFDALKGMMKGEVYVFTFNSVGTFSYHNHLTSSHKGTIIVEE